MGTENSPQKTIDKKSAGIKKESHIDWDHQAFPLRV